MNPSYTTVTLSHAHLLKIIIKIIIKLYVKDPIGLRDYKRLKCIYLA